MDVAEAGVADEGGLQPDTRRCDVHPRVQPNHSHDVAVEVHLPEQSSSRPSVSVVVGICPSTMELFTSSCSCRALLFRSLLSPVVSTL
ncbi:hypothetical protein GUJ93_ZPchr0013g36835 [Zizania palustris]|uniref:Uncharacterized protein n=1 Tax=Zizania palustris TaxID=103762 RepID=A0A8J5WVB5_ZIZPA|nr:hypothetical protein GUJ93_ZPchr0013g36835 [Zizania palustris]